MLFATPHPQYIMRGCLSALLSVFALLICGCQSTYSPTSIPVDGFTPTPPSLSTDDSGQLAVPTPFPTRPAYSPGELVDYIAQTGDTLPSLAVHFNTTVEEILAANTFIPQSATTLPPGMPMKIPIYYAPFWGSPYQILPDSLLINGPAQIDFDSSAFIAGYPGWLNGYVEYAFGENRTGAQIIDYVAQQFSVSPRLLLALVEYQSGALIQPELSPEMKTYPLGNQDWQRKGLYLQLVWAANLLNNGFYGWRTGSLITYDSLDGRLERPDPWQNAATVALQHYYARFLNGRDYDRAISQDGFARTYKELFGDPWQADVPHIPGSLVQPEFTLPFAPGLKWAYTGGPHTGYGQGEPFSALDFAPGAETGGCTPTNEWTTAVAAGIVARSELGTVVLDMDGDGDERTGWVLFYFHVGTDGRAPIGSIMNVGDPLGHPSCEGGRTTGTHVHIARKYNGEWIPAEGVLAFNLEGWIAHNGSEAYQGTLTRNQETIIACDCANAESQIEAGGK
jgi:LasA protease